MTDVSATTPEMVADTVTLERVHRRYLGPPPVHALRGVDLAVTRGDYVAIVGPSGSGKSTALNIIGLLDRPDQGVYRLRGRDITTASDGERTWARGRTIGFVFQSFHLLPQRSALENVALAGLYERRPRVERLRRAETALARVGLAARSDALPTQLSGGERQRVAVARAVANQPSILLADEPTGNLDSISAGEVLDLFDELHAEGLSIVVITHNAEVAARAAQTVEMRDGEIVRTSTNPGRAVDESVAQVHTPASVLGDRPVGAVGAPDSAQVDETRDGGVGRSRVAVLDLVREVVEGAVGRPARTALTAAGVALGVATLVATVGLARTAGSQISAEFDALEQTQVVVTPAPVDKQGVPYVLPADFEGRVARIDGVVAAGSLQFADPPADGVWRVDVNGASASRQVSLATASPGLFEAVGATIAAGRFYDGAHVARGDAVAVVGRAAARQLGIGPVSPSPVIEVEGQHYDVVGILDDVDTEAELLTSVILPPGTASLENTRDGSGGAEVIVRTDLGAASVVASQAAAAIDPRHPDLLRAIAPPTPKELRDRVETELDSLLLVLGGVSLVVGALGIANVTLVGVMERRGEIGLRRALGASRRHIATQFLAESGVVGLLGGVLGANVAIVAIVAVAASRDWTPVLDPWLLAAAPTVGIVTGLAAGAYPAARAASVEPAEALRSGV